MADEAVCIVKILFPPPPSLFYSRDLTFYVINAVKRALPLRARVI